MAGISIPTEVENRQNYETNPFRPSRRSLLRNEANSTGQVGPTKRTQLSRPGCLYYETPSRRRSKIGQITKQSQISRPDTPWLATWVFGQTIVYEWKIWHAVGQCQLLAGAGLVIQVGFLGVSSGRIVDLRPRYRRCSGDLRGSPAAYGAYRNLHRRYRWPLPPGLGT